MEEKSSFRMLLGNSHILKVLDFFLEGKEFNYNSNELAEGTKIRGDSLHRCLSELVNLGIIRKEKVKKGKTYTLNKGNPLAQKLLELDWFISKKFMERELERAKITV